MQKLEELQAVIDNGSQGISKRVSDGEWVFTNAFYHGQRRVCVTKRSINHLSMSPASHEKLVRIGRRIPAPLVTPMLLSEWFHLEMEVDRYAPRI